MSTYDESNAIYTNAIINAILAGLAQLGISVEVN
jgi:hypothetical protein